MANVEAKKRYQARISIDDRLGDLWHHLASLPERCRVSELIFLAQLGLATRRAIEVQPDVQRTGIGQRERAPGPLRITAPERTEHAEESVGTKEALAGWSNVEIDFPQ